MRGRLGMALLGCGAVSHLHRRALREGAPAIEIAAAIDRDPARAAAVAAETGAPAFATFEAALAGADFEAVDVMLPHHLHEEAARAAFTAGKHVLLEKPMATTVAACERILAAARAAGTVFMVAENAQYWPEVLTVGRLLQAGAIGEVVTARGCFVIPPLDAYYGAADAWRLDRRIAGGGVTLDTGTHWIRPLRMWLGEVEAVVGALGHPYGRMQGESLVRALLRFRSGVVATLDGLVSGAPVAEEPHFRVTGTAGEVLIERPGRVILVDGETPAGRQVGPVGGYLQSYPGQFADFAAAVLEGRSPAAGAEMAVGELRVALALYRSAETGRWESVWA